MQTKRTIHGRTCYSHDERLLWLRFKRCLRVTYVGWRHLVRVTLRSRRRQGVATLGKATLGKMSFHPRPVPSTYLRRLCQNAWLLQDRD